jgi:hypothetical protein
MSDSNAPAEMSFAKSGEVADKPDDPVALANDEISGEWDGYLEDWGDAEWIWADANAVSYLDNHE